MMTIKNYIINWFSSLTFVLGVACIVFVIWCSLLFFMLYKLLTGRDWWDSDDYDQN